LLNNQPTTGFWIAAAGPANNLLLASTQLASHAPPQFLQHCACACSCPRTKPLIARQRIRGFCYLCGSSHPVSALVLRTPPCMLACRHPSTTAGMQVPQYYQQSCHAPLLMLCARPGRRATARPWRRTARRCAARTRRTSSTACWRRTAAAAAAARRPQRRHRGTAPPTAAGQPHSPPAAPPRRSFCRTSPGVRGIRWGGLRACGACMWVCCRGGFGGCTGASMPMWRYCVASMPMWRYCTGSQAGGRSRTHPRTRSLAHRSRQARQPCYGHTCVRGAMPYTASVRP
jgi:hypothetical protein